MTHHHLQGESFTKHRGVDVILQRRSEQAKDPKTVLSGVNITAVQHGKKHGKTVEIERRALVELPLKR